MASSSKLFQAPTSLPQLDTAARPSVSSPAFPPNLTSHSQTNSGIPKRSMDLLFEQNTSNAVIDAPAMTGHAGQEQRQLGAGLDTISHDPISSSGVFASGPSLSAGLGDDAAIAPAFVERSLHQPSQRSDPLFTDGLPEVASALMWSLLPKGEQSQSTSKSSLLKYLPTVISQMQLDLQHHLELRSQGQPHGNVSKMSEDIIQTARWLAAKGKVVPVSQHQRPTLKVSLTSDQPSSSSRLQVSSQTRPGPPAPYAQPVIVQSTPVTQTPRPINALSVPTDHHARLIAPPVFDGESIERAWVTALDNVGSHMQSAWYVAYISVTNVV